MNNPNNPANSQFDPQFSFYSLDSLKELFMFEVIAQLLNSLVYIDYKYTFKGNSIKNRLSLFILVSIRVSVYHRLDTI